MMDKDITDPSFKYAPSQNPMTPLGVYKPGALPNTMAQQVDFVPSGDNFADNIDRQTRQRIADQNNAMMLSMSKAAAGNAEEAAAAQRLGYETGVGADIAARNKQLLEQRLATDRLAQLDLFNRDPVLARMLANKDFAAVAHDDLPNLMESGEQINPDLSWFEEFKIGRARGYKGTERGITGMDMLLASAESGAIPESLRAKAAQQSQEMAALRASGGFLESFGALEGNIESTIPKQAEMAVYGAVAGGIILGAPTGGIGLIPGMIAGAGSGVSAATITQSFQIEGGNLFIDMLDDGIPEDTALVAAPIGGAIIASLELLPLKFLSIEAKRLVKREIAGQVLDTLKQTGMLDVFKRFLQAYGIGVSTEVGTELAQDAAGAYVQEMAMLATDPLYEEKWKSEKGRAELAKQFVETFIEVGQGMAIMGAFLPGANFIGDARRARKAKATRQFFKDIDKNASESKLKGRNPRSYQEWFEEKARGTANHTLFIDIEKLREAMAKNNVSAEQLETILPGVTKAIADAKGMNGIDFAIPTSVYAARLSDLAFGQALQEHMRFDPNDMSIAENNQYVKEREKIVEEMKQSAMELMKADAAIDQSAQAVTDLVTAQLVAAGKYTESEARSMASVASASATVMSARFNMTPLDWHNKYGAKVFGEGKVAQAAPLEQANQFDQAGKRRTDTQEFRDYFGDSKVVDENNQPLEVYHGTNVREGISEFIVGPTGDFGRGIYFTTSPKTAAEYAGTQEGAQIVPVYLSLQNPLVADKTNFYTDVAAVFGESRDEFMESAALARKYDNMKLEDFVTMRLKEAGYDGVIVNVSADEKFMVAFAPEQAKSVYNRGTWSRTTARILEQVSRIDANYMAAVESGDMETAQRMVDEAAKLSMPNSKLVQSEMVGLSTEPVNPSAPLKVVFHGGRPGTTTFDQQVREESVYAGKLGSKNLHSQGIWLAPVKGDGSMADFDADTYASNYQSGVVYSLYANITNPARVFDSQIASDNITVESLKSQGYDGAFLQESGVFVAFDANQVKSADPITRDAAGNVIPLSRRFNIASPSILEQASRIDLGLGEQAAFNEANQRPEIVSWAKEKFGDRTAPDGSIVWQNFTEWFGDSKTVDAEGKPVMVYHGTDKKFTKVNMKKGAQGVFWVASDKAAIESGEVGATGNSVIMELFASIKNPAGWNEYDKKSFAELIRDGYDGVILRDKDGSFNAIAFTPTQIKSAGENVGTFSQVSPSILEQAARVDVNAKYMAAVKRDDMETAQQMVIEAANAAGYTTLAHHGTDSDPFDVFDTGDEYNWGQASYFSPNLEYATMYSEISRTGRGKPRVLNVALDLGKTFSPETNKEHLKLYRQWAREQERLKGHGAFFVNGPIKGPYGSTKARNVINYEDQWWIVERIWEAGFHSFTTSESDGQTIAWGVRSPNQIKLIDPVTRDESGKIIPLSKRFNFKSPSILEQATVSATTYSALDKAVGEVNAKSLAAAGWKEQIKGWVNKGIVKQSEVEWSGLVEYLDMQEGKITKETVSEFLKNNGVKVETVTLGDRADMVKVAAIKGAYAAEAALGDIYGLGGTWQSQFETYRNLIRTDAPRNQIAEAAVPINELLENEFGTDLDEYIGDAYESGGSDAKYSRYVLPGAKNYREVLVKLPVGFTPPAPALSKEGLAARQVVFDKYAPQLEALEQEISNLTYGSTGTDAEAQRLADAGNEREALETQRDAEANALYRIPNAPKVKPFISSHWDESNVLVHLRMNDRTDADGKRVLFVEEVQSDYGQEGKKKGFVSPVTQEDIDKEEKLRNETREASRNVALARSATAMEQRRILLTLGVKSYADIISAGERRKELTDAYNKLVLDDKEFAIAKEKEVLAIAEEIRVSTKYNEAFEATRQNRRPFRAPFVETTDGWLNLGLKHVMLEAINGGYDRVAFVDGDQSVTRYKDALTEAVDEVEIDRNDDGTYNYKAIKDGKEVKAEESVTAERIEDLFGKSGGADLIEQADAFPDQINTIKSEDIKIGGEGMRKFYDDVLPAALNKLLKKYGGEKLQQIEIDTRVPKDNSYYETLTDDDIIRQRGFDVTDTMKERVGQGLPLFQAMPSGSPRATIDLSTFFITLNTAADLTSYLHEMSHFYMATYVNIANEPGAPPQITADLQIIFDWLGIKDLASWNGMTMEEQRKYWEAFGYNHEIYLFEGKSPSVEMQGVFDRFSAWLRKIYGNIRNELNVIYRRKFGEDLPMLTPDVRGVMDRMLATEKQIKYAESVNNMTPLFLTQEQSGYDDARWAAYQAMVQEAHDQSVTDLTKASLRQMEWLSNARTRLLKEMQAKHDDIRDKMRSDIAEEVAAEPVYMAMSVLKTGKGRVANGEMVVFSDKYKLNLAIVKKMIPAENLSKLGYGKFGMLSEDGLHPDMVAEMFGFKSGDELVLALLAAKPVKEEVDSRLDARMLAEYGDMNTPAEMEVQVQKALHNEARERFIGVEARFVASATRPVRAMTDAARLAANTIVNAQKIKNIRPSNYAAAEARAARDAADAYKQRQSPEQARKTSYTRSYNEQIAAGVDEATAVAEATKKGDQAAAAAKDRQDAFAAKYGNREPAQVIIRAKQAQVVQNQLVKVSAAALEEVDTAVKDFRKFFGSDEKIAKSRNMDLVDAARAILSYYGFGKVDKNPADYIKKLEAYNPELYAEIEPLINQASTGVRDYTQMTMDDFRMLRDVVDALWAQSRRDKQITVAGKKIALDGVLSELDARLNEIGVPTTVPGEKSALTTKEKFAAHLYSAKALLRRVENWADATDGAGGVGAFTKYIYRPVKDAVNAYRVDRNNYVKRFVDLVSTLDLPVGKITSPELDYTFGVGNGGIGKAELLGAMLHTGNESNYKKLLIGRKWGEFNDDESVNTSRWDAFVGRMITEGVLTKEDFDFLQAVWDLNEEIKPIAQRAHRDLYGYYFKEVEATSFTNRFGTYRGGYVPAKTDAAIVRDAQRQAKAEELEADFRSSMPSTGMGFTKGRVEYNKPLSLDVRLMAKHIDDVLRFANIQPAIKDALRIVNNRAFADKLSSIDPTAVEFMLLPWLNRTARQSTNEPGRNKVIDNFWRTLRSRTGMSIMFANLRNALQQVTGLFPSALKVSKGALKDSLFAYLASPRKTAEAIAGLSPFMNERMHSQIFEIQDQMNDLLLNPSKFDKIQKWSQHHGYFLQSAFQNFVDIVTWNGKYNQVLSEIGTTLSDSEAQAEAIQQADAAVRSTQGSMSAEDVAAFEVGSPFYKTFVQFTGYFNMLANLNTDEYVKVLRDLGWRGNKGKLVSIYMLGFLAPTLVADAIARSLGAGWDDDDDGYLDDVADWFFGSQVRAGAAMVPFGSAAYTAFAAGFTARTYDDRITSSPSIGSLEASTVGVGKAVVNLASDDKELTGRNVRDVLTLITNATGVPVSVLGRPIGYQMEVNRGKVEPTDPIDYMRGLITGVPSAESKKK